MFGLMQVFGNGVIEGWNVTQIGDFSIGIDEGRGNINYISARTTFPTQIDDLSINETFYVYAIIGESSLVDEGVTFRVSTDPDLPNLNAILISRVKTNHLSITEIDNTVRQNIGFIEQIKEAIKDHKHRGGSLNPSKIDLTSEVKGQLPSYHIAPLDADKITSGTLDLARMPFIDHDWLLNVGLLSHAQLDSFVKTLEHSNKEIFGEISTSDLLQHILALKYIFNDPESDHYTSLQTDENLHNQINIIPGITDDQLIDFEASSAEIDLDNRLIKGVPPTVGSQFFVHYDTALAWENAYSSENVAVIGDSVTLAFNDDGTNILSVEDFEGTSQEGDLIPGFSHQAILLSDNAKVVSESNATDVVEGFFAGEFTSQQSYRSQFTKEFADAQDWSTYDSFVMHVKTLDSVHGEVKLFFTDSSGNTSAHFLVLDQNETTSNIDPAANAFKVVVIDLRTILFRNDIKSISIYTDDTDNPFSFLIDDINIQRAILLPDEGKLKLRYSTQASVTFSTIEWESTEPSGTSIDVRARSASGTVFLTRQSYTSFINNGDVLNLSGTDIEIEVVLQPNSDKTFAPTLHSLKVLVVTDGEIDGYTISTTEEYARGSLSNAAIDTDPTSIALKEPVYVGSYYYALSNLINQVYRDPDTDTGGVDAELGILGVNSPIAPNQVFRSLETTQSNASANFGQDSKVSNGALGEPRSVTRLTSRNFLVADTYNDRILQFNEDGSLEFGIGSINYNASSLFPVAASFNTVNEVLYLVWSQEVSFSSVNLNQIELRTLTTRPVQLLQGVDKINGVDTSDLGSASGQIMPIHLSETNAALAKQMSTGSAFIFVRDDAISTSIDSESVFYNKIKSSLGIPLFVGNFSYIDGIFTPTWAQKTDDDTYIITNATLAIKEFDFGENTSGESVTQNTNVTSVIEVNASLQKVMGSDKIQFSPFIPGRAEKIGTDLLIGGIRNTGNLGNISDLNFRSISGNQESRKEQKNILKDIFQNKAGAVLVLDTRTQSVLFEYISSEGLLVSDVDIDSENQYVVAESSFDQSGRVIKLDPFGNIVFSFGESIYSVINRISVQSDDSIVIST